MHRIKAIKRLKTIIQDQCMMYSTKNSSKKKSKRQKRRFKQNNRYSNSNNSQLFLILSHLQALNNNNSLQTHNLSFNLNNKSLFLSNNNLTNNIVLHIHQRQSLKHPKAYYITIKQQLRFHKSTESKTI